MAFDHGDKPEILFLAHRIPYPLDKGDRIRTFHILRFLARRANVHLACLADESVTDEDRRILTGICHRVQIVPLGNKSRLLRGLGSAVCGRTITEGAFSSSGLRGLVHRWAKETKFHAAMGSASSMASYLAVPELANVAKVLDLMDVDSQKWLDFSRARYWPLSWVFRTEGNRLRRLEQELARWARAVMLVSEAEAEVFRSFCAWEGVHAVSNGVDLDYFQPTAEESAEGGCAFVGRSIITPTSMPPFGFAGKFGPASISITRNRRLAWWAEIPRRPFSRLADVPGVRLVGQVPDVRPFLTKAAVVVAPLRIARGLQNKVLEALAMSKAVVASRPALAALQCQPGADLLAASTAAEWIEAIRQLLENASLRKELGTAGRNYVEEHHSWDRCLEPLADLLGLAKGSLCPLSL